MKILLCVNSDIGRGNTIGTRMEKVARRLKNKTIIARANYSDLKVKTPCYGNYLARILNALRMYLFPSLKFRSLDMSLFDSFVLRELKKDCDFNRAHIGEFIPKSIKYLKKKGIKVFLDIPIALYNEKNSRIKESIKLADVLIVPSPFVKESVSHFNKEIRVVPFGVEKRDIEKEYFRDNRISFLFAGSVNKRKGAPLLIDAWKELNLEKAELVICGRIYKEVKKRKIKNMKFKGFLKDMDSIWKKSDLFVFPSNLEGSAKVVYEAMSYGLPVITTYNAGSIVKDGKEGFIIPAGDKEALKEKILFFYNNREKVKEMGKRAREKANQYSWERYAKKLIEIYEANISN